MTHRPQRPVAFAHPDLMTGVTSPGPLRVGGRSFDIDLLDLDPADAPTEHTVTIPVEGTISLPAPLTVLTDLIDEVTSTRSEAGFRNDPCVVFTEPPCVTGGSIVATMAYSTYYAKSAARDTIPAPVAGLLAEALTPSGFEQARANAQAAIDADHPLRWPAAGVNAAVLTRSATGAQQVLFQRRAMWVAVNPGRVAAGIAEGFSEDDVKDGNLDVWGAVQRGAAEEFGMTAAREDVTYLGTVRVGDGVQGYNFLFAYDTGLPTDEVLALREDAPDANEASSVMAVDLTPPAIAAFLRSHDSSINSMAVLIALRCLELTQPGSAHAVHALLLGQPTLEHAA